MVGTGRFELPTPRTPSECSTRLSHVPTQSSRFAAANRLRGLDQFTPAPPQVRSNNLRCPEPARSLRWIAGLLSFQSAAKQLPAGASPHCDGGMNSEGRAEPAP